MEHPEQYTEEQERHFRQEFQKRKKRRITYPNFVLFGMPKHVWGPIFTLVILGLIIFIIVDWRCPVCKGLMGEVFQTKFCPKCGFKLMD
jgi:rubrerythrin